MPPFRHSLLPCVPVLLVLALLAAVFFPQREKAGSKARWAGLARVDITPAHPVRLTGYGGRPGPHRGVLQRLWADALAIGGAGDPPALWLTMENCGITREVWLMLRDRICRRTGVLPERVVLSISHTHNAPATSGWAPFIQPEDLSADEAAAIDAYTHELLDKVESVAAEALSRRFPALLSWSEGSAGFAANRRPRGGPVDHALPVLKITGLRGELRALVVSYACHCTACTGAVMQVGGDWAGVARTAMERDSPGVQSMITIGCAGDADPFPRGGPDGGVEFARQHGESLAAEVRRLLAQPFRPLHGPLTAALVRAPLPYDTHFTREQWEQRALATDIAGRHARHWLPLVAAGQTLPLELDYEVTAWRFGDGLNMLFLPGEVVVDFSLRLKQEAGTVPLWINAYSNWVPCYIPSRRILQEGGYEAETSLWYYNRPGRLAPATEDTVVRAAHTAIQKAAGISP